MNSHKDILKTSHMKEAEMLVKWIKKENLNIVYGGKKLDIFKDTEAP